VDNSLPPVIWPDHPEHLPSFSPDQIPEHPEVPDLNYGAWYWVDNDGVMSRCFVVQPEAGHDLPGYAPQEPPEAMQPGEWVVVLVDGPSPAWGWIPSAIPVATPK
jgi:hypothetical protein